MHDRIARARAAAASKPAATADAPFLPLCSIELFLRSHALFQAARLDLHELHRYILEFHALERKRMPSPPPWRGGRRADPNACSQCGADVELDAREGCVVCTSCGVVQREVVFGGPSFQPEPEISAKAARGHACAVSLVASDEPHNNEPDHAHRNQYAKQPDEEVRRHHQRQQAAFPKKHSKLETVVCAALFHGLLRGSTPAEEKVRAAIAKAEPIERVEFAKKREFKCACGAVEFSRKAARFHCKWK